MVKNAVLTDTVSDTSSSKKSPVKTIITLIIALLVIIVFAKIFSSKIFQDLENFVDAFTRVATSILNMIEDCLQGTNIINPNKCLFGFLVIIGGLIYGVFALIKRFKGSDNPLVESAKFLTEKGEIELVKESWDKSTNDKSDKDLVDDFKKVNEGKEPTEAQLKLMRVRNFSEQLFKIADNAINNSGAAAPEKIKQKTQLLEKYDKVDEKADIDSELTTEEREEVDRAEPEIIPEIKLLRSLRKIK